MTPDENREFPGWNLGGMHGWATADEYRLSAVYARKLGKTKIAEAFDERATALEESEQANALTPLEQLEILQKLGIDPKTVVNGSVEVVAGKPYAVTYTALAFIEEENS